MTAVIRVVIADDDVRARDDFRQILESEPDIDVVAVADNGASAVQQCAESTPDVCVMDIRMPLLDGIEATVRLQQLASPPRVLVVTTFDLDHYVLGAVRAGAAGFVVKQTAVEQLAAAVRTVARGEAIVSPRATARLLRELVPPVGAQQGAVAPLTDRETDVVRLMAQGLSNDEIAAAARISRATVKTHVSSILAKLGRSSRIQIVVWAYEQHLAPVNPT